MATFDIVIPHYGKTEALNAAVLTCLDSIRQHSECYDYRVILVDNGTKNPDAVVRALSLHRSSLYLPNPSNLGFVKATNQGLAHCNAPYVVLLNNDTVVAPNWLEVLRRGLDGVQDAGLCGPLTTTPDSWQGRWAATKSITAPYFTLPPGRMLAFFCVMIRREVLERVGFLEESYGVGFGDDDDYCRRAEDQGFSLVLAQRLIIQHAHRTTFKELYSPEEIKRMQDRALLKFHSEGSQFMRKAAATIKQGEEYADVTLQCGHHLRIKIEDAAPAHACIVCIQNHMANGAGRFSRPAARVVRR
jgi:GT2 family glycosyltransferase